ncbi:MAG: endonuclease III domain-containing protein [Anaerolineae bacterium]
MNHKPPTETIKTQRSLRETYEIISRRLSEAYGEKERRPSDNQDLVAALVNTILSQNTNDHNRDIAFQQLQDRFPTWEAVRDAAEEEVIEAVRPAGLAPTKGPRIQEALQTLTEEQGEISLAFLRDLPLEEARGWLTDLNGVGPKTAAIVLLFGLGRPAFPVDTHVHRVTRRLGLIPKSTSREKAHELLEDLVPEEDFYSFHLNVIEHGRTICVARSPKCEQCMLSDICRYYQEARQENDIPDS